VVIGDLVGDTPSLRSLVKDEDPHGITDSLLYGVSLNKIGYAVEGTENLYVMPSGSDALIHGEILPSARWAKLAAGFYENAMQALVQGVLAGAGAIYLFTRAVVLLGASRAVLFPSLVPPFTLLIGYLTIGEAPSAAQLAGLVIVIVGFRLTQRA